jgi:tRNA (guanine-N7-)-methyltransferase
MIERITLDIGQHKPIRSFVERKGRISPIHKNLVDQLWPKYGISLTNQKVDLAAIFGRNAPVTLEIGFGDGRSLLKLAAENPDRNFIGIEVYKAGIVKLLVGIHQRGLTNIRVFCADAIEVLKNCVPEHSLEQVLLFFPDPWPKARHHKRRIVQNEFIQLIASKLQGNGIFHMATDWEEYAQHMLSEMENAKGWVNCAGPGNFSERPSTRSLTKFEQRGLRLGYGTWDLIFSKRNPI